MIIRGGNTISAPDLRERITLQGEGADTGETDEFGNPIGGQPVEFTVWARIKMLVGTETVMAQRLSGVQPAVITVRSSSETRQVDTSWTAVDARKGTVWNIRSVTPDERNSFIDLLCEAGVA